MQDYYSHYRAGHENLHFSKSVDDPELHPDAAADAMRATEFYMKKWRKVNVLIFYAE